MAANTNPIYTITPVISWASITAADGNQLGTDADVLLVLLQAQMALLYSA